MANHSFLREPLAVLALFVAVTSACGGAPATSVQPSPVLKHYHDSQIAFDYPPAWQPSGFHPPPSTMFTVVVYLSTEPLHQPCFETSTSLTCGSPLDSLRLGGVLVTWGNGRGPGFDFNQLKGEPMAVGRHRAVWQASLPGTGAPAHADDEVLVIFDNAYWVSATAAKPNLAAFEQQLRELVASTTFTAR